MNVLVIGGTGLIGNYLLGLYKDLGYNVSVVTRDASKVSNNSIAIVADLNLPNWLEAAGIKCAEYDVVVFMAYATTKDEEYNYKVTVGSVIDTVRYFSASKLSHFIYIGSMSVFGLNLPEGNLDENCPRVADNSYAYNKVEACKAVSAEDFGFPVSILHPTGVYDSTSKRIKTYQEMLKDGYMLFNNGGKGINNIVHAYDVATAIVACVERKKGERCEEYIINGELINYSDWFRVIENELNVSERLKSPIFFLPLYRGPIRKLAMFLKLRLPIVVPIYKRNIYERHSSFLSDKAKSHFNWEPTKLFKDVIKN